MWCPFVSLRVLFKVEVILTSFLLQVPFGTLKKAAFHGQEHPTEHFSA